MASLFVMEGGNIVHLQKILGHHSVQMTERYAHLAPEFIEAATRILDGYVKPNGHVRGHVVGDS
jgi:integrase